MKLYPSRKAARMLGIHPNTLRRWADTGKINHVRTDAGQRLYDVDGFLGAAGKPVGVCYCRVSSPEQRDDLERQIESMRAQFEGFEIIQDIGSGLNYKRKGLESLLGRLLDGEKLKVVVAHRDRLVRFGFELFEYLIEHNGGELVVLDNPVRSAEQELSEDLLAILHVFSCRMHGKRIYEITEDQTVSSERTEPDISAVARCIEVCLQQNARVFERTRNPGGLEEYQHGNHSEST